MKKLILFLVFTMFSFAIPAQNIVRGPYLQMPTSASMKVLWRTDTALPSKVYYGKTLATVMDNFAESAGQTTEHNVQITGLEPYTFYYYAVSDGQNLLSGPDSMHRFRTHPVIGTEQPFTVWAIGDFGKANQEQIDVRESFVSYSNGELADLWLWLGDNAYNDGTDLEFQEKVFDEPYGYKDLLKQLPFMATPGNHDYNVISPPQSSNNPATHSGPYYDIVDVPVNGEMGGVPSGYELYYSFDYGNVHFLSINSEIGSIISNSNDWIGANPFGSFNGSPMTQWIEADLQANDKPWVIAFFHQPPHSDGSHFSGDLWERYMAAMRTNICPILEQYGVDLIINGHSHVYERSYLINGYFGLPNQFNIAQHALNSGTGSLAAGEPYYKTTTGPNANKGAVYVVQGNSGSKTTDPRLEHPAMVRSHGCNNCVGSTILSLNGDTLKGIYLTGDGQILDEYAIIKTTGETGINEVKTGGSFGAISVVPNPFSREATVQFTVYKPMNAKVELTDLNGKVIRVFEKGRMNPGEKVYKVNAQELGLSAGSFLFRITASDKPAVARLLRIE